jgi:NAD(P)-dependent dehydrogenase (short-subunit alcohol dehydrogenase family)
MTEKQRCAVVTGSSKGFGLALTKLLIGDGWNVLGIARHAPEDLGNRYRHLKSDLSTMEGIAGAQVEVQKFAAGSSDQLLLVNNAAVLGAIKPLLKLEPLEMNAVVTLNLMAPLALMKAASLAVSDNARLEIVNISTGAAHRAYAGWALYCSTKAALRMASLTVAEEAEHSDLKLRMMIYEPGVLDTGMQKQIRGSKAEDFPMVDKFVRLHESGQLASPHSSAAFLLKIIGDEKRPRLWEGRFV